MDALLKGIFDSSSTSVISLGDFLLCVGCALAAGAILAGCYMFRSRYTKSFVVTLILLPAVVCVVIMMVNGNIGTGVAVAGAFSLVRFRSIPGTAKEIGALFLAMGTGLVVGMGYLVYGLLIAVLLGLVSMLLNQLDLGTSDADARYRTLRITIPEDLDYTGVFDDIFEEYTTQCRLTQVKTTNMGSLFRLTYLVTLTDAGVEKQMIDQLRCRNGNLEITVSGQDNTASEL